MKRKPLIADIIGEVEARLTSGGYVDHSSIAALIAEVRRLRKLAGPSRKLRRMAKHWRQQIMFVWKKGESR